MALVVAVVVVACRWCLVSWSLSVCGRRAHLEVVRRFWFWVLGRGDGVYVCVPSVGVLECVAVFRLVVRLKRLVVTMRCVWWAPRSVSVTQCVFVTLSEKVKRNN